MAHANPSKQPLTDFLIVKHFLICNISIFFLQFRMTTKKKPCDASNALLKSMKPSSASWKCLFSWLRSQTTHYEQLGNKYEIYIKVIFSGEIYGCKCHFLSWELYDLRDNCPTNQLLHFKLSSSQNTKTWSFDAQWVKISTFTGLASYCVGLLRIFSN